MRIPIRWILVPLALLLVADVSSRSMAQQQPRPGSTRPGQPATAPQKTPPIRQVAGQERVEEKPQRPGTSDFVVPQLSPELETILKDWERESSKIKSLHGRHWRFVYNKVFEVEKRSEGIFYLETPDKGRIDLAASKIAKDEKSKVTGPSGRQYRLEPDRPEKWICTGDEIVVVNEEEKSFEVVPLPDEMKGKNIVNSPLPFLFGMKAEDTKRRFDLTLKSDSEKSAVIVAKPRFDSDRQNYKEAWIVLDKSRYLPSAVKLFDPSGNLETVYSFEIVYVNNPGVWTKIKKIFNDENPFKPDLIKQGYKNVIAPRVEEAPAGKGTNPFDTRSNPSNGPSEFSPGRQKQSQLPPRSGLNSGVK
jgi:TIGR03009 family protein